jgi:hypothetical protein
MVPTNSRSSLIKPALFALLGQVATVSDESGHAPLPLA